MSTPITTMSKWVLVALSLPAVCQSQVINGSFEDGMTGWTSTGGLSRLGPPDRPAMGVDGSYVAVIGGADIPDSSLSQTFPVRPTTDYVLTLATAAGGDNYYGRLGIVRVDVTDPLGNLLASQSFADISPGPLGGTNGFVRRVMTFRTSAYLTMATLTITDISPGGGVAVDPFIDDVKVWEHKPLSGENLLVNGGFEAPVLLYGYAHQPTDALSPWRTTDDSFEVWMSGDQTLSVGGLQNLEILSKSAAATISQVVPTVAGDDYVLSFYHSPRPGVRSTLSVAINSQVIASFSEDGSSFTEFDWRQFRTNFSASASLTEIAFTDESDAASGTHLDNVELVPIPPRISLWITQVDVCWPTVPDRTYQVQYQSDLTTNLWINLGTPIAGNGETNCISDSIPPFEQRRFYRVVKLPK